MPRPPSTTAKATVQVCCYLPRPAIKAVEAEASAHGLNTAQMTRSIIRQAMGGGTFQRSPQAPAHRPLGKAELERHRSDVWVTPDMAAFLDRFSARCAGISRSQALILILLEWLGITPFPIWGKATPRASAADEEASEVIHLRLPVRLDRIVTREAKGYGLTPAMYLRLIVQSCRGYPGIHRNPDQPSPKPLGKTRQEDRLNSFRVSPGAAAWLDAVGNQAAGIPRSVVASFVLLEWLGISPYPLGLRPAG
jgi:hypothetical protein